jgi:hypothetical protein
MARNIRRPQAFASLILLSLMVPSKNRGNCLSKGRKTMKLALVSGLSGLAMIVGASAALAQANINPNVYPGNTSGPYGYQAPWEWHAGPGPSRRGNMCVKHTDIGRGYGYQEPCPPKKAAKK